jgi:hypothetical protein
MHWPGSASFGRLSTGGTMIRAPFAATVVLSLSMLALPAPTAAQEQRLATGQDEQQRYTEKQLDNLVSPIALYPDPLLAQLLIAATFPDQVEDAAAWVRANGTNNIDEQSWDVSVKAVAHYPSALNMMADKPDWMATLGRAYAFQSTDVMLAVQRMRALAAQHGNLVSNQQQQVVREDDNYVIIPAQPRVIYVPVYDPLIIYTRPVFGFAMSSRYWSWGIGFPIGGWLPYDCDWGRRVVYYNGWNYQYLAWGGGWRARSRPFIHITNVYVNPIYQTVLVGRSPYHRRIDYDEVDRWGRVHRDVYFGNRRGDYGDRDGWVRGNDRDRTATPRDRGVATPDGYTRTGATRDGPRDGTRDGRGNNTQVTGPGDDYSRVGGNASGGDRSAIGRGGIDRSGVDKGNSPGSGDGNGTTERGKTREPVSIGDVRGRGQIDGIRDRGRTTDAGTVDRGGDRGGDRGNDDGDRAATRRPVPIGTILRQPQQRGGGSQDARGGEQRAPETRSAPPQRAPETRSAPPQRAPETRSAPPRSGGSSGSSGVQRGAVRRGN